MSIVWVSSFFKYGERFVPAKEATGIVPDSFYVEGALCITVDGQEFLTLAHADLVDQLWLYVVDGLRKLRAGDVFETYFPDSAHAADVSSPGARTFSSDRQNRCR